MSAMRVEEQSEEQQQVSTVGNENDGDELNEQKKENIALKAKVQVLEAGNIQHVKNTASLEEMYQIEIASEAENEIVVPIHQMKVLLPSETWYDLLSFLPRRQLGNLASQIGDYQFADILQSFLHGFGKIKLGKMEIIPLRPNVRFFHLDVGLDLMSIIIKLIWPSFVIPPPPLDHPMVQVRPNAATNMPNSSMPRNIKDFEEIQFNYLDLDITSYFNFLGKFQQNSLLTDVNMQFHGFKWDSEHWMTRIMLLSVLTKIVPFITSIDSLEFLQINLFKMVYNTNFQLLLKEIMVKTRILVINWHDFVVDGSVTPWEDQIELFCSWLYTPRNDDGNARPRMLRFFHDVEKTTDPAYASFIERIKKDFKDADHPVSFFIYAIIRRNNYIEDISYENDNEKLVIKKANHDENWEKLLIGRYPLKAAKKWIEANEKEITEWDRKKLNRKINL